MKDPSDSIRQWVYTVLSTHVTYNAVVVPVYSFAPKDAVMPYILIGEQLMTGEQGAKDSYMTDNEINIEIYSSHTANDATYKAVSSIAEDCLELLRTRLIVTTITGYNSVSITLKGSVTDRFLMEDKIIIYKSLNINLLLEEQ
jgi:hypothetical protein